MKIFYCFLFFLFYFSVPAFSNLNKLTAELSSKLIKMIPLKTPLSAIIKKDLKNDLSYNELMTIFSIKQASENTLHTLRNQNLSNQDKLKTIGSFLWFSRLVDLDETALPKPVEDIFKKAKNKVEESKKEIINLIIEDEKDAAKISNEILQKNENATKNTLKMLLDQALDPRTVARFLTKFI